MPVDIAVNVDYYRSDDIDGSRTFLQSPVSPKRQPGKKRLVRQDQGKHKNQVSFEPLAQMTKVGSGCYSTYAHGVLIKSSPDQSYRQGDRVWLTETAQVGRNVSVQNQRSIGAVSLRTWERMTLALGDVCWIPKFRKIDCGVHEEELLTISGPPVKKKDRKLYLLAVVQRLRVVNGITIVESVELREIVEQGSFKYQNLTLLPDGKWRISELFHRSLASVAPAFFEMVLERPTTNPSNTGMPQVGRASDQITSLATPPPEDDLDLRRTAQRCEPLIPAVPVCQPTLPHLREKQGPRRCGLTSKPGDTAPRRHAQSRRVVPHAVPRLLPRQPAQHREPVPTTPAPTRPRVLDRRGAPDPLRLRVSGGHERPGQESVHHPRHRAAPLL
ncbi:hypothetical protein F5883DRAFT_565150 [Diaporthe sp. PMI_573]|nr:hypothetical protein F5883DRAFT_565150 [Diaporthaceae sp. PMI_573]